jgi:hypothetical protein
MPAACWCPARDDRRGFQIPDCFPHRLVHRVVMRAMPLGIFFADTTRLMSAPMGRYGGKVPFLFSPSSATSTGRVLAILPPAQTSENTLAGTGSQCFLKMRQGGFLLR